jgi:hypothetical protein
MVGQVMWELIEPLDDESVYACFLAEKGEGVHRIAVAAPSFDDAVAAPARRETSWCSDVLPMNRTVPSGCLTNVAADKHFSDAASPQW